MSDDQLAFYNALETNDGAVQVLGYETLREIAHDSVKTIRINVTIDRSLSEKCPPLWKHYARFITA